MGLAEKIWTPHIGWSNPENYQIRGRTCSFLCNCRQAYGKERLVLESVRGPIIRIHLAGRDGDVILTWLKEPKPQDQYCKLYPSQLISKAKQSWHNVKVSPWSFQM
jgi:hypothetical protein